MPEIGRIVFSFPPIKSGISKARYVAFSILFSEYSMKINTSTYCRE